MYTENEEENNAKEIALEDISSEENTTVFSELLEDNILIFNFLTLKYIL